MSALLLTAFISMFAGAFLGFALWIAGRLDRKLIPIVFATAASFVNEMVAQYFKVKFHDNSMVYYFGNGLEYGCFAWFISCNLNSRVIKKIIMGSVVVFAFMLFAYCPVYVAKDPFTKYIEHHNVIAITSFVLCIWCAFYIKELFDGIGKFDAPRRAVLLIIAAMLFYNAFSTIFFTAQSYLITLSVKADPLLFTNAIQAKKVAITAVFKQFKDILPLLFGIITLLYVCIFIGLLIDAFDIKSKVSPEM